MPRMLQRGVTITRRGNTMSEKACALCGDKNPTFLTGKSKYMLNNKDVSPIIEEYWGKGIWLCIECAGK